jgi:hypothetical protein
MVRWNYLFYSFHSLCLCHRRNPKGLLTIGRDDFHYGNFGADVGHCRNHATIRLILRLLRIGWHSNPSGLIQKIARLVNRGRARVAPLVFLPMASALSSPPRWGLFLLPRPKL